MGARLYVETYEVDTLGDIDVDFTYSIADITDIERRSTSYSKTLVLPSTPRNQKLFGNIFDISVRNDYDESERNILSNFNPSKQAKAQIFLDNVKIFDGVLRLIKINNKNGDVTYETNVFGRLKDILHTLGDKTLADLNFVDYDHTWNIGNIESSWSRTGWVDGANNYVYPLVDYGYTTDGITYPLTSFKPALFVREIIKRMFAESGFKILAPFFDTQYFKKIILVTAEKNITKEVSTLLDQRAGFVESVGNVSTFTKLVAFTSYQAEGFLIQNSGTRFRWNRTQTLNSGINFISSVRFISQEGGTNTQWICRVKKNGATYLSATKTIAFSAANQSYYWDISLNIAGDIAYNDYFEVEFYATAAGGGTNPNIDTLFLCISSKLTIGNSVPVSVDLIEGDTMKIKNTLPKSMKQRDFLKSIITMHNLYIIQDKLQDNLLEIIPYPLFYINSKEDSVDWTYKLDYSQDISILPVSEISSKEYRIGFDTDSDYWSGFYQAKFNEGYGESRTILDNDFELDTKTIKVIFAPPVIREEVAGRIMLHLYKVENGVKVKDNFKPRVVYWKPNISCSTWNISRAGGTSTYTTYPYAGHLDNPIDPVADLLFGTPKEVYFSISVYPGANLYGAYYQGLITSIGDKDSRLLQGYFYLTPQDIMDLDFRRIVKVGNHYYQLQKVDRYNPIGNTLSYVSLYKILTDLAPQDYDYILLETDFYMLQENGISKFYI